LFVLGFLGQPECENFSRLWLGTIWDICSYLWF